MPAERIVTESTTTDVPSESKIAAMWTNIEQGRKERILSGQDKPIIIVQDTKDYEERRKLPTLSGTDRFSDIKVDDNGNLYTSWYQPKRTEVVDGRRRLVNPENRSFIVFPERNRKEGYLEDLPKEKPVYELIFGESVLLEEAIRHQQSILDSYQPGTAAQEIEFARQVIAYTEGIALKFLSKRTLSREDLDLLAHQTAAFLENINLYNPLDPHKIGILDKLLRFGELDVTGRPNYLGELSKVFATHAEAVDRITEGGLITDKFLRNLGVLMTKRGGYRWRFELTARELEMILELRAFQRGVAKREEREAIMDAASLVVSNNLSDIEVKPYLRSARWAAINIVGSNPADKSVNREILGDSVANKLYSKKTAKRYIKEGNFAEAGSRIRQSIAQLRKTNNDYKDIANA